MMRVDDINQVLVKLPCRQHASPAPAFYIENLFLRHCELKPVAALLPLAIKSFLPGLNRLFNFFVEFHHRIMKLRKIPSQGHAFKTSRPFARKPPAMVVFAANRETVATSGRPGVPSRRRPDRRLA